MVGIAGFNELLDVGVLLGGSLAEDGDSGLRLEGDLLQVLALVAQDLADEVEAGKPVDRDVDFVHEFDAAFLVEFDVLLVGRGPLHHRLLAEFADLVVDDAVDVGSGVQIDLSQLRLKRFQDRIVLLSRVRSFRRASCFGHLLLRLLRSRERERVYPFFFLLFSGPKRTFVRDFCENDFVCVCGKNVYSKFAKGFFLLLFFFSKMKYIQLKK